MKIFSGNNLYYANNHNVRDLVSVEINTVQSFVYKHSLNHLALLNCGGYRPGIHGELIFFNSDDPIDTHCNHVEIDFINNSQYLDILYKILIYIDFNYGMLDKITMLNQDIKFSLCLFESSSIYLVKSVNDPRTLFIEQTDNDNIITLSDKIT